MMNYVRLLRFVFSLAAFASLLMGTPAAAGVLTIQYSIVGGTIGVPFGFNDSPYNGGGSFTVAVAATSPTMPVTGPATLVTLNATTIGGASALPLIGLAGSYPVTFGRTAAPFAIITVTGGFAQSGTVTVVGTGSYGLLFVTGTRRTAQFWFPGLGLTAALLTIKQVGQPGDPIPLLAFGGVFKGQEVSRTFVVPEPSRGTLLATGLLGLVGFEALARRRR
jgi:hypothetical protein